ncbi:kinesin-like protein KIF18A [Podargus strigoides]
MSAAKEEDVCNHVRVVVRVRPESQKERDGNFTKVVHVVDRHTLLFDPKTEEEVSFFHGKRLTHRDLNKRVQKDLKFVFDAVLAESSSQLEVFEHTTKGVIDGFLNGYNCTVLAYGATGAGKTHTMLGSPEDPGVMYLTMMALYNCMDQIKEDKVCNVAVSYLEVYNEQIRDLLANSGPLAVHEDGQESLVVDRLTFRQPKTAEEILQMLDYGNRNRTQHPTDVNASSSRSHAVFQSKKQHIPYRNSKLTHLLKDSLGGNCRTIMIAAVSPSSLFYDDTYNTLQYANRAKAIKSSLKSNVVSSDSHISQYAKIYDEQKKEILMLKEKLREYKEKQASIPENHNAAGLTTNQPAEIRRYKEILKNVFANREEIRKEYLKLEMQLKENTLKTYYQKQCHEQIQLMCSEETVEKATCKQDQRLAMLQTHRIHMQKKKEEAVKHFEENANWLHRVENEMRLLGQDGCIPKELCKYLQCCHLSLKVKDLTAQIQHMLSLVSLQHQYYKQTEKVLNTLLPVLRKQYLALKEAGLTNKSTETEYGEVEQSIQRQISEVWADQTEEKEQNQTHELELSAIFAFPQLVSRPTTPCCKTCGTPLHKMKKKTPQIVEYAAPSQKRTRRKLMNSPVTPPSPTASGHSSLHHLEDSLIKDVHPLVYTPESCRKPVQTCCAESVVKKAWRLAGLQEANACNIVMPVKRASVMDTTCDVIPECDEADMNSTVTLYEVTGETTETSPGTSVESQPCSNHVLPRIRQDVLLSHRALREPKIAAQKGGNRLVRHRGTAREEPPPQLRTGETASPPAAGTDCLGGVEARPRNDTRLLGTAGPRGATRVRRSQPDRRAN